jgi:hypothetical protein
MRPLVPVLERAALSGTGILWRAGARGDAVAVTKVLGPREAGCSAYPHDKAAEALARAGILVVQDRCLMAEHRKQARGA